MNYRLVTHTDLDGVGCEVLFRSLYGREVKVDMADYNTVNDVVKKILQEDTESVVFISDLSVNEEVAEFIEQYHNDRVVLLDHHPTAKWIGEKYDWAVVSEKEAKACGTLMMYETLGILEPAWGVVVAPLLSDFTVLVNDYDLWIHEHPASKQLNALYYLIGREAFVERFLSNPSVELTPAELRLLEVEDRKKKKYIERIAKAAMWSGNGMVVFGSQYVSELGHYILEKYGCDYVAIIDLETKKVSLRSQPDFDCSAIAKMYGGGGHKNASGFQIEDWEVKKILDIIL